MRTEEEDEEWSSRWAAEMGKGYSPSQAAKIADRFVPPAQHEPTEEKDKKPDPLLPGINP